MEQNQKLFQVNDSFSNEEATAGIQQYFTDILSQVEVAYELAFGPETSIDDRRKLLEQLAPSLVQLIADSISNVSISSETSSLPENKPPEDAGSNTA